MRVLLYGLLGWMVQANAADWARFRGPNGSGVDAVSKGLPVEFGPSKNVLWKAAVPYGRSSPVLFGDRLYLTAGEGDALVTLCYRRTDGKLLWRQALKKAHTQDLYKDADGTSPSVTADAAGVYVFFAEFGLIAYTPEGKERWRHPLGPFDNFYGMASSPVLEGDTLLMLCDQTAKSFLLALDRNTGKPKWKTERVGMTMSWSVPIVWAPAGQPKQVVVVGSSSVDSYYLATGERRWWMPVASEGTIAVPAADGDSLILSTSGHNGAWAIPYQQLLASYDKDKNGTVSKQEFQGYADWKDHFGWIDADRSGAIDSREWTTLNEFGRGEYGAVRITPGNATGALPPSATKWRVKKQVPYVPSPLLYHGVYYMVKDGGIVTALNPETGAVLKQGRAAQSLGTYYASPVAADGKVFLLNAEGKLTVLKAGAQWEVLGVNDLQEDTFATPAIADNRIYVRTRGALYCFGAK
ncbi:MAG: PQQ-binding-like beta-propeller repeat protein [Bryobacterales bacterium]|nr:PQQ-binding-like beta-propeller repeat protein [Bryobacterales bacterium]